MCRSVSLVTEPHHGRDSAVASPGEEGHPATLEALRSAARKPITVPGN
jgi:hypothetical protein